ncbi:Cupin domain-containing protein [Amycolatopsis lurida]|uniref:Cupin n=1 Tax=Amycolatopsis lurida NRRL 2430 TaxID=1460371 RepID=A0A2P2FQI5_AMYLU|nr:cupin domain-containing protein [Amycolatopsis lurida]KFU78970.1 cupin [Amycolatopsis lurida NRRL 2430]SED84925.1 Cupin domain-containing protein [Amycolatopsis lurida]
MTWTPMSTVEGLPLIGGQGRFRTLATAEGGLAYEISYPAGVASPVHSHDHDSIVYLVSGSLRGTLDSRDVTLEAGGTIVHPRGVPHSVEAIVDSQWIEFKTPLPARPPIAQ